MKRTVVSSEAPPATALGYIRCSTEEQASSGLGLEAQRTKIVGYAAAKGMNLLTIFEDAGESAKSLDRPAYRSMQTEIARLREAGTPLGCVIVLKLDRLSRSQVDLLNTVAAWREAGTSFASVQESFDTSTPMGRCIFGVLASFAELERENTVQRTKDALAVVKAQNGRLGRAPYGFRPMKDSTGYMAVPSEIATIDRMFTLYYIEGHSARGVAHVLRLAGVDADLNPGTILRRLSQGIYLPVISHAAREAALRAGVESKVLPKGSVLDFNPSTPLTEKAAPLPS